VGEPGRGAHRTGKGPSRPRWRKETMSEDEELNIQGSVICQLNHEQADMVLEDAIADEEHMSSVSYYKCPSCGNKARVSFVLEDGKPILYGAFFIDGKQP
jgi:hypothetical protein